MQKTLPKGWKWVRLGDVVNVDKGKKMELLSLCLEKSTPYIGIDNLRTNQYTNFTKDKNGLLCIETDLLIVWDGANAGTIGYGLRGYAGSTIARLRPSEESITKYLGFLLKSKFQQFNVQTHGAAIPHLSKIQLLKTLIPLPPLPIQHKIVEILEEADNLRKLRQQADEKMKDLIPSIFIEMFGDPKSNIKKWRKLKFADITKVIHRYPTFYGQEYVEEGVPVVRISDIQPDHILNRDLTQYVKVPKEFSDKFPLTILEPKDIVMAVRGDTTGKIGIVPDEVVNSNISPNLIRICPDSSKLNPYYLFFYLLLTGNNLKSFITNTAKKSITAKDLKSLFIEVPPMKLQQEFAERVEEIESEKVRQAESRKKLDELFNSLMQRAFTGELVA